MILSFIISAGLFFLFTTYLYNARWALVLLPVYSIAYILFINFENLVGYRVIMAMLFVIGFVIKYLTSHKKKTYATTKKNRVNTCSL